MVFLREGAAASEGHGASNGRPRRHVTRRGAGPPAADVTEPRWGRGGGRPAPAPAPTPLAPARHDGGRRFGPRRRLGVPAARPAAGSPVPAAGWPSSARLPSTHTHTHGRCRPPPRSDPSPGADPSVPSLRRPDPPRPSSPLPARRRTRPAVPDGKESRHWEVLGEGGAGLKGTTTSFPPEEKHEGGGGRGEGGWP